MGTNCKNEECIAAALRRETPEIVPSFCQSIMGALTRTFMAANEESLTDDMILLTPTGDLTIYKAFGYSSHWVGCPSGEQVVDDAVRDRVDEMTGELHAKGFSNYTVTPMGVIRGFNNVASWAVEGGIKTEKDLKLFMNGVSHGPPTMKVIDAWRETRSQCMDADFVPFASASVIMQPANQCLSFALTAKLTRKDPALLEAYYDYLVDINLLRVKGAIAAGAKLFCTADDMAYKSGPMMAPEQYRKFFVPRARRICDLVHDAGGLIFMHTDGYIDPVMDCFVDAGYDAIQPLEPTSMGYDAISRVKKRWGDKLAVIGNCDTSDTLSFKTPAEVRAEVHSCFKQAMDKNGEASGYVFAASGSLHDKVRLENALAMMDEYKKIRDGSVPA